MAKLATGDLALCVEHPVLERLGWRNAVSRVENRGKMGNDWEFHVECGDMVGACTIHSFKYLYSAHIAFF